MTLGDTSLLEGSLGPFFRLDYCHYTKQICDMQVEQPTAKLRGQQQQSGLKGFAEKRVIEVLYNTPETIVREAAFGDETMNMRIPFQGTAESVKNTDETGDKVF